MFATWPCILVWVFSATFTAVFFWEKICSHPTHVVEILFLLGAPWCVCHEDKGKLGQRTILQFRFLSVSIKHLPCRSSATGSRFMLLDEMLWHGVGPEVSWTLNRPCWRWISWLRVSTNGNYFAEVPIVGGPGTLGPSFNYFFERMKDMKSWFIQRTFGVNRSQRDIHTRHEETFIATWVDKLPCFKFWTIDNLSPVWTTPPPRSPRTVSSSNHDDGHCARDYNFQAFLIMRSK